MNTARYYDIVMGIGCAMMLLATGTTWLEILKHPAASEQAVAIAPGEFPPEAPKEAPRQEAPEESMFRAAIPNTAAVFVVDAERLLASPLVKSLSPQGTPAAGMLQMGGIEPGRIRRLVIYVAPDPENVQAKPQVAAVVTHSLSAAELEAALEQNAVGDTSTVAGRTAYPGPKGMWACSAEEGSLLVASSTEVLEKLIEARETGGGVREDLSLMVDRYTGYAFYGGLVVPEALREQMRAQDSTAPEFLRSLTAGALGLDVAADGLTVEGVADLGGDAQAGQAAAVADAQLELARQRIAAQVAAMKETAGVPGMAGALGVAVEILNGIEIAAEGSRVTLVARLTNEQIQELARVLPVLIMQSMMGGAGGMPAAP